MPADRALHDTPCSCARVLGLAELRQSTRCLPHALPAAQSLNCEHNALGSEASFLALGSIPGLRSLSLAHNRVEALPASPIDAAFSLLTTLDLAHNLIVHEEALLPVLQMGSLRMLLIYGNPFLKLGAASDDFHEVGSRPCAVGSRR